jgi:hypothetical protein
MAKAMPNSFSGAQLKSFDLSSNQEQQSLDMANQQQSKTQQTASLEPKQPEQLIIGSAHQGQAQPIRSRLPPGQNSFPYKGSKRPPSTQRGDQFNAVTNHVQNLTNIKGIKTCQHQQLLEVTRELSNKATQVYQLHMDDNAVETNLHQKHETYHDIAYQALELYYEQQVAVQGNKPSELNVETKLDNQDITENSTFYEAMQKAQMQLQNDKNIKINIDYEPQKSSNLTL